MIQGVRDVFEMVPIVAVDDDEEAAGANSQEEVVVMEGKMVLIGRGLADLPLQESLRRALLEG